MNGVRSSTITTEPYLYTGDNPLNHTDPTGLSFINDLEAVAPVIVTVASAGVCIAQPEVCAAAAIADAIANTSITGAELAFNRIPIATGIKDEAMTLATDGVGFVGAKFWGGLTKYAEANKLLGSTAEDIARNKRLLNSPSSTWTAAQTAIYLYVQNKEKSCPKTG
jgi:hypothetical protein